VWPCLSWVRLQGLPNRFRFYGTIQAKHSPVLDFTGLLLDLYCTCTVCPLHRPSLPIQALAVEGVPDHFRF